MIPPHLFYQIYLSFLEQNDCTPSGCGAPSEYTDSAHTQVEDPSLGCMNVSNVYDRCGHDTRQLHPSCTACRTATLPGLAWQNEACSWPHRSNHLAKWRRYIGWCNVCVLDRCRTQDIMLELEVDRRMKTIHNKNKFQLVSDKEGRKEILLNDALNTFYLWLYGVRLRYGNQ